MFDCYPPRHLFFCLTPNLISTQWSIPPKFATFETRRELSELTFAKTSGRVRSNDPRNNCGAHFGSSLLLDSKVASTPKVMGSYAAAKQGLPGQEVKKYLHVGYPLTSCSLHRFVSVAQSTAPIAPSTLFSVFTFLAAEEYSGLIFLQCGHPSVIKTTGGSS